MEHEGRTQAGHNDKNGEWNMKGMLFFSLADREQSAREGQLQFWRVESCYERGRSKPQCGRSCALVASDHKVEVRTKKATPNFSARNNGRKPKKIEKKRVNCGDKCFLKTFGE